MFFFFMREIVVAPIAAIRWSMKLHRLRNYNARWRKDEKGGEQRRFLFYSARDS